MWYPRDEAAGGGPLLLLSSAGRHDGIVHALVQYAQTHTRLRTLTAWTLDASAGLHSEDSTALSPAAARELLGLAVTAPRLEALDVRLPVLSGMC